MWTVNWANTIQFTTMTSHVMFRPADFCIFYRRLANPKQHPWHEKKKPHTLPGVFFIFTQLLCAAPLCIGAWYVQLPFGVVSSVPSHSFPRPVSHRPWLSPTVSHQKNKVRPHPHHPLSFQVLPSHLLCGLSAPLLFRCGRHINQGLVRLMMSWGQAA